MPAENLESYLQDYIQDSVKWNATPVIACSGENWAVSALSVKQIRTLQGNVLLHTQRQVNKLVQ